MAHISSIGAAMFSDLAVGKLTSALAAANGYNETNFKAAFATFDATPATPPTVDGEYVRILNVRDFPAMGTPPNIVNVPTYGQKTSQQIQGQSDAPQMEIQLNYVPADWAAASPLGSMVGNSQLYVFRFSLLTSDPVAAHASQGASVFVVPNSQYFWVGKMEAISVTPSLTDAVTATLTLTMQSPFYGAYTSV